MGAVITFLRSLGGVSVVLSPVSPNTKTKVVGLKVWYWQLVCLSKGLFTKLLGVLIKCGNP